MKGFSNEKLPKWRSKKGLKIGLEKFNWKKFKISLILFTHLSRQFFFLSLKFEKISRGLQLNFHFRKLFMRKNIFMSVMKYSMKFLSSKFYNFLLSDEKYHFWLSTLKLARCVGSWAHRQFQFINSDYDHFIKWPFLPFLLTV